MRGRTCCVALAIGLVPLTAAAQDGLRSASLPERTLSSALRPPREDVHRARPETYRPHPNRVPMPVVYGYNGPQMFYPAVQPIIVVQIPPESSEPARVAPPPVLPLPVPSPAPYVAGTPGSPRTFYLIPGCYAGDRRPDPESLAPGCNISQLRVVPPRP